MNSLIKITFVLCLIGLASAIFPLKKIYLVKNILSEKPVEIHSPPALFEKHVTINHHHSAGKREIPYTYEYGVQDHRTGDYKSAWEKNDGHNVVGGYTLHEADGSIRVVNYKADPIHGFTADVKHIGKHD